MLLLPTVLQGELEPPFWIKMAIVVPGMIGVIGLLLSLLMLIWQT